MAKKRPPTIEACKKRNNRILRLNHVGLIDEDIEWLYDHVPVGTRVYIY